jgi:hypothetical protein
MRQHPPVPEPVRILRATRRATGESGEVDADLTQIVDAWPELPEATEPPPAGSRWVQQSAESPTSLGGLGERFFMPQPSRRSPGMPALGIDQAITLDWKWSPEGEGF